MPTAGSTHALEHPLAASYIALTLDVEESLVGNRKTALRVVEHFLLERRVAREDMQHKSVTPAAPTSTKECRIDAEV